MYDFITSLWGENVNTKLCAQDWNKSLSISKTLAHFKVSYSTTLIVIYGFNAVMIYNIQESE